MMEGLHLSPEEEYIWAMRAATYVESDSELWKKRLSSKMIRKESSFTAEKLNAQVTKVLSSLVPDEIIYNVDDYNVKNYEACLLFGDVSGFTDLSEKYSLTGKGGPSRLTQVLNGYIGSMVQEILSHNGDLLKFSGDAFLAMWKTGGGDSMQDCVHQALDCAVLIQKSYGTYETDVGVLLKVKLAISAGGVLFSLIGDDMMSHYVIVGQPIWDVKAAEHKSSAGEIIVSPTAWHFVNPNEYSSEFMSDGLHVKVLGVGPNWRHTQKSGRARRSSKTTLIGMNSSIYLGQDSDSSTESDEIINENEQNDFALRPSVDDAARLNLKEKLRKFIILPVMRGIDLEEPLEYLTEMRQIVILFINVVTVKIDMKKFLSVVNEAYIIVCRLVNDVQGCVNKVSLFDKDLMFLVIFGLRGYKHDLESQIGLVCARRCFRAISNIENVKSTSIGVTTGMSYCGVVGHTLRREYTVISTIVNKAARIMVAYPNRVTCDRDTFIHSKMESKYFKLQELKELKGIAYVGPIYEYSEEIGIAKQEHALNVYPILGRDKEQALYLKLLGQFQSQFWSRVRGKINKNVPAYPSALLIRGMSRQGKTRLSDELMYITPHNIPVSRVTFIQHGKHSQPPYTGIREILKDHLQFDEKLSNVQREQILTKRLKQMKVPELICCLNEVFQVQFRMTPEYIKRNDQERVAIQKKMIKQLFYGCFMNTWVIVVDNVNFMDKESWILLEEVLNTDSCFFIFTSNSDKEEGIYSQFRDNSCHTRIHIVDLMPIDKWYFVGIACQILNVIAIPPILEKNIEERSHGNPGWIESFLISLLQAGGIGFDQMTRSGAYAMGLVLPSIDMIVRLPKVEKARLAKLQKQLTKGETEVLKWEMFRQSYKDSKITFVPVDDPVKDKIDVAILTEFYSLSANSGEISEDALILKTFDSLTPYEQQLLKTASVLGDIFTRNMLFYIMNLSDAREAALAIKKLFELRIIACAQGDFTIGQERMMDCYLIFNNRFVNPAKITEVRCFCEGISMPLNIEDLPKYANCGYIRFVLSSFRETTYDLLIDTQRKELHKKSLRYLEKEVRRCQSCGGGFFVKFMGVRYDDGLVRTRLDRLGKISQPNTTGSSSFNSRRSVPSSIGSSGKNFKGNDQSNLLSKESEMLMYGLPHCFLPDKLKAMRQKHSITRTFSGADFTQCQCNQILNTMYSYMLYHAHGAGSYDKMIDALLEYAYVCITERNIPHAIIILSEALHTVEDKNAKVNTEPGAEWKSKLIRGKIKALMGYSRFVLGQPHEALKLFRRAMVFYGFPFPSTSGAVLWSLKYKKFKQKIALAYVPSILAGTMRGYQAEFSDNLAECLGFMYILFKEMHMWDAAELAAVWELNRAMMSEMDFYSMAVAFSNVLEVSLQCGNHEMCLILEVHALQLCYRKITNIEINELQAVAMMYASIFRARLFRSELNRAINIGYTMLRICNTIKAIMMTLNILPNIILALILNQRILEAVTLLFELDYYGEEDTDNSGKTWYYGLALTIQLYTGYTVISYYTCRDYFRIEGETMLTFRDPQSEYFYFTALWLWCVRTECWEQGSIWYFRSYCDDEQTLEERATNLFTGLAMIEGLLIYLVLRVDKRNVSTVSKICSEVNAMFLNIKKKLSYAKIIEPRYWHLKAYFRAIGYYDSNTYSLLDKAKKLALKHSNVFEAGWIEHSRNAWTYNMTRITRKFWVDHCFDPDTELDFHELEDEVPIGFFTLPLPRKPILI